MDRLTALPPELITIIFTCTENSQDLANLASSCRFLTAIWREHFRPICRAIRAAKVIPCLDDALRVIKIRMKLGKRLLKRRIKTFPGGQRPLARHIALLRLRVFEDTTAWTDRFCTFFAENQMTTHTTDASNPQAGTHSLRPLAPHEKIRVIHASYTIRRYVALLALERFRLTRRLPPALAETTIDRLVQIFIDDADALDEDLGGLADALDEIATELYNMPRLEAKLIEDIGDAIGRLAAASSESLGIIRATTSTDGEFGELDVKEVAAWSFALAEIMFVSGLPVTGCYCGTVYATRGSIPGEETWD